MKPLYIFDLDGTLALIDHRRHFVEGPREKQDWKGFYAACTKDKPNWPVLHVMEHLLLVADVWIFSGRSDEVQRQTVEWLTYHTSFSTSDFTGDQNVLTMRSMVVVSGYDSDLYHGMLRGWKVMRRNARISAGRGC